MSGPGTIIATYKGYNIWNYQTLLTNVYGQRVGVQQNYYVEGYSSQLFKTQADAQNYVDTTILGGAPTAPTTPTASVPTASTPTTPSAPAAGGAAVVNPIVVVKGKWDTYNTRILQIRDQYYLDQQTLRLKRDTDIKTAQDKYAADLVNLQTKYQNDLAAARGALAGTTGT